MILPNPATYGSDLNVWADAVAMAMHQYPSMYGLVGDDWQRWGMVFFNNPSLDNLNPPNPYHFTRWQDWGQRLADALNAAPDAPTFPGNPSGPAGGAYIMAQTGAFIKAQTGQFLTTQPNG